LIGFRTARFAGHTPAGLLRALLGPWGRPIALAALCGLLAGLGAAAMEWGIEEGFDWLAGRHVHADRPELFEFRWAVLLLPALGCLVSGLLFVWLAPKAVGHGTSVLTRAFHHGHGQMPLWPAVVGAVGCVVVIACGGSAGPEGPIAALGAAIGSTVGASFGVSPRERRVLLVAGCAAGVGAIFRCPLGGALFAVSILYSEPDYETEAIVPSFVASVVGYSTFMALLGYGHFLLKDADKLVFSSPLELLPYAVLGPLCGGVSILFYFCFDLVERRLVPRLRLPRWAGAGLGGLATGVLACVVPAVMDNRYHFIQGAMDGRLFQWRPDGTWWDWAFLFALVVAAKALATSCTVGSGAAGGVLGPSVFLGGASGALVGAVCEALFPGTFPETLRQALIPVGMGGVLAASMRVPLAAIVMVIEMTGSYGLIVPLMVVCISSYVVGRRWGLNPEQVPTAADSPVHAADAIVHLLESWRVDDVADRHWPYVVGPAATLKEIVEKIEPGSQPTFAVVDNGRLCGVISLPDLRRHLNDGDLANMVLAVDIMTEDTPVLVPESELYHALELFRLHNASALPVVRDKQSRRWVGMLTRRRVFEAVAERIDRARRLVLEEYQGLVPIDQEAQLDSLLRALAPKPAARAERWMVPLSALGKSIRECDFRKRFGAIVVAIEMPDGTLEIPPDLDRPLEATYRLIVIRGNGPEPPSDRKSGRTADRGSPVS